MTRMNFDMVSDVTRVVYTPIYEDWHRIRTSSREQSRWNPMRAGNFADHSGVLIQQFGSEGECRPSVLESIGKQGVGHKLFDSEIEQSARHPGRAVEIAGLVDATLELIAGSPSIAPIMVMVLPWSA